MADTPAPEFPAFNFPNAFVDGVMSISHAPGIVKIYLSRYEPDIYASGQSKAVPTAQVIMPLVGFLATFAFFENQVGVLLKNGTIRQEDVDVHRRAFEVKPNA